MNTPAVIARASLLLFVLLWPVPAAAQSTQWLLMSRHGECTDAGPALRHKFQDLPPVSGPENFATEMKNRGVAVKVTNAYGGNRDAVLIEVPAREASLLFVKRELCREFTSPR